MKRILFLALVMSTLLEAAHAQSACQQLGMDHCAPPHPSHTEGCDAECRAERKEDSRIQKEHEKWKRAHDQQVAEKKRQNDLKKLRERIDRANGFARQAYHYYQLEQWKKALEYYDKALGAYPEWQPWHHDHARAKEKLGRYEEATAEYEAVLGMNFQKGTDASTFGTSPELVKLTSWALWQVMDARGYNCPSPPYALGSGGVDLSVCSSKSIAPRKTVEVPTPYIEGRTWTAAAIFSKGTFTITTTDGHVITPSSGNLSAVNLSNARVQTGPDSKVQFLLPDETVFTIGANGDMMLDDFVYDPATGRTSMLLSQFKGTIRLVSAKVQRAAHEINVKFPALYAGIRGTDFLIWEGSDERQRYGYVGLFSGEAEVSDNFGKKMQLKPGTCVIFTEFGGLIQEALCPKDENPQ